MHIYQLNAVNDKHQSFADLRSEMDKLLLFFLMTVLLSLTLPVCCSCMTFYLSRPHVYTAACFLKMMLYMFAF